MHNNILQIDSSGRDAASLTRQMSAIVVEQLQLKYPQATLTKRNVAKGVSLVDEPWITANFTPATDRSFAQISKLSESDTLVAELENAQHIVIGAPIYNFSLPASLKAWIDMVARAGLTFKYTESGSVGLLSAKRVYLLLASGGVEIGSSHDFSSNYLKHVLSFLGLSDVLVIDVNQYPLQEDATIVKQRIMALI
ncbi:MAG TPA: FMN-dependent NADH-azoreductase [Oceanospirillales bacterium]|nr:FMN-dependent NADH-azoreductase [Oceanospirillales bacterium]